MPTEGKIQKSAGVKLKTPERCKRVEQRTMKSRSKLIETDLYIDNCPYKGNALLNAQK